MTVFGFNGLANSGCLAAQHVLNTQTKRASEFENLLLSLRFFFHFTTLDFAFYIGFQGNQLGEVQFRQVH
ncbi:hypothetical protein BKX93_04720 [Chromobacterium vaccinii]|uniref:Uncharacterized protein n=1 Tax=Chromobacterium vaccinii TaxID=1108595 RepID=A0A1D9LDL9_9NEIS|nr:hypothetical protein BKX93_04720 [Chromobacterium vaccinii]